MLKQYEYNGYIGEAELSKNRKKTKVPLFSIFLEKTQHGDLRMVIGQGSMLSFLKKNRKKMYFSFFYGALVLMTEPMFQLQRPKITTKLV